MKKTIIFLFFLCILSLVLPAQKVISIKIDGAINPAIASFVHDAIEKAAEEKAECLLINLNTPGGLLKSTRVIVSDILESPVPIVVYVSPGGAHAGSAGVFITLAAHVAAMAPSTNIGAAHPVGMQGNAPDSVMNDKITNDASAFIRSIAEKRNKNVEWAEDAVRNSVSITETEALQKKVIDLIAANETELLNQLNGREVQIGNAKKVLNTKTATVEILEMDFIEKFLHLLSDPNIAYILMMVGFYGILFELYSPGTLFPGIVGGICLILAFYSMHTLPINYAGLALIVFGIILFILEIKITSYGLLSIGGIIALVLGSMMLIRTGPGLEMLRISWFAIIGVTAFTTLFFLVIIGFGLKAQRAKVVTGEQGLMGKTGIVIDTLNPEGVVQVQGELWKAESNSGIINQDSSIIITGITGLKLWVEEVVELKG